MYLPHTCQPPPKQKKVKRDSGNRLVDNVPKSASNVVVFLVMAEGQMQDKSAKSESIIELLDWIGSEDTAERSLAIDISRRKGQRQSYN